MCKEARFNLVALAFDLGLKRTGVATGQTLSRTAQPAGQISALNGQLDWQQLDKLIADWQPEIIVIGDPHTQDPHLKKLINRFKSYIQQNHKLPIKEVNEELTSFDANERLKDYSLALDKKIELRDQVAACIILEDYFNSL